MYAILSMLYHKYLRLKKQIACFRSPYLPYFLAPTLNFLLPLESILYKLIDFDLHKFT